ncbi:MAG: DUF2975 domain-containing protein [Candidatus Methanoplasma sp.]|jgi:hypothetical protein|nr:DUF2975 domain-containing protein [Candidatus Methanoplasma sp.]
MGSDLDKLNTISWWVGVIAKIAMVLFVCAIAAICVLMVVAAFNPDLLLDNIPELNTKGEIVLLGAMIITVVAFVIVILYYVNHLFMGIRKNNTPFTDESVKDLKTIAILVLVCAIVAPILSGVAEYVFDVGAEGAISFSPLTLFVAFVFYVLSLVFSYGAALQKESDETL